MVVVTTPVTVIGLLVVQHFCGLAELAVEYLDMAVDSLNLIRLGIQLILKLSDLGLELQDHSLAYHFMTS